MMSGNVSDNLSEMKASEITLVKTFIGLIGAIGGLRIFRAFAYFFLNPEAFFISSSLLLLSIGLYAEKICLENASLNRNSLKTKPIETEADEVKILDIFVQNKDKEIEKSESEYEIGIANNEPKYDLNGMYAGEPVPDTISKILKTLADEKLSGDFQLESGDCSVEII